MRTRRPLPVSYEELLTTRHGSADARLLRPASDLNALLTRYHGADPRRPARAGAAGRSARSVSLSSDDGRSVLAQRMRARTLSVAAAAPEALGAEPAPASVPTAATSPRPAPPVAEPVPPSMLAAPPLQAVTESPRPSDVWPATAPASGERGSEATMSDAELMAELEAIVNGKSVYDPAQKKTVARETLKEYPRPAEAGPTAPPPPALQPGIGGGNDAQAIFERLAQSMQYAGAYDLGTVELENRFNDFDRVAESREAPRPAPARAMPVPTPADTAYAVDSADFLKDLDAIRNGRADTDVARSSSVPSGLAQPLYDTGEHVLPAMDLYVDQLPVGKPPGVPFSYGQIIAMADLFESVDHMNAADAAQLKVLKDKITASALFYSHRGGGDIDDDEWDEVTGGRYADLAEDNYAHFAPNELFGENRLVAVAARRGNHRSAWEQYHRRAIDEARRLALEPTNAQRSYVPTWALTINAFGDHFLTDAFSAGHLVNKETFIEKFKQGFLDASGKLRPEGKSFLEQAATLAWHGDLARNFKRLETYDKYDAIWNIFGWHPDIKNAERFASVLTTIAEKDPEKVGNVALKALHDVLNKDGIEVSNVAGEGAWLLTGDGHLTPHTLDIMKKAVMQSIANINSPEIQSSKPEYEALFHRVWQHVPVLTSAGDKRINAIAGEYTQPGSKLLLAAAAHIIHRKSSLLIKALIRRKALRPID